ncbi:MAG: hypothetical protein WAW20_10325, partial [Anaerolineae bacterium]
LDSLPTGGLTSAPTFTTPTFSWQRVEGASGYTLQVDDNNDFSWVQLLSSPIHGWASRRLTPDHR